MSIINSVLGPISADDLGVTLIHEHLVYCFPGWECDTAAPPYDRERIYHDSVEAIEETKRYGLKTFVDLTPIDGGRDPELYTMVAEKTGINIICSTGLFNEYDGNPNYFRNRAWLTGDTRQVVEDMCESFIKDITKGIGHSGVKAGVIKVATGKGAITPYEKMVLAAGAMAQKATGVPIITHTEAGTMAPEQVDLLVEKGADVNRLMIGHIDNEDVPYLEEVLQRGACIGFDRFGLDFYFTDAQRMKVMLALIRAGYEKQILLSNDAVIHWPGRKIVFYEAARPLVKNWKLSHVLQNVLPALREAGVTDDQIKTMIVDNPRRLFTGEPRDKTERER